MLVFISVLSENAKLCLLFPPSAQNLYLIFLMALLIGLVLYGFSHFVLFYLGAETY